MRTFYIIVHITTGDIDAVARACRGLCELIAVQGIEVNQMTREERLIAEFKTAAYLFKVSARDYDHADRIVSQALTWEE